MTSSYTFRAAFSACVFIASATGMLHAQAEHFSYTDSGTSITITRLNLESPANIVVPATIDGKPVTAIGWRGLSGQDVRTITLPDSIKTIAPEAFFGSQKLVSVNIPDGVTTIGESTFSSCVRLVSIDLPSSVTDIGENAFSGTNSLKEFDMPGIVTIGDGAFRSSGVPTVTFPGSLKSIGDDAFLFSDVEEVEFQGDDTKLGNQVFSQCNKLTSVKLPSKLKSIGTGLFFGCKRLGTVRLPESITAIGDQAFQNTGLTKIKFGSGVTTIGVSAFADSKLTAIDFGPKVRTIGEKAFYSCTGLRTVEFPKSVKSIGKNAFVGGNRGVGLSSAVFTGKAPTMGKGVFKDALPGFKVFLEDGTTGFTTPRWEGYRIARPSPEIVVESSDGSQLVADEGKIAFGDVVTGGKGKAVTVTIRNVGIRNLTGIRAITKGGQFANFSIANISKTTIKPGKTAKLRLVFQPKDQGLRNTTLRILSSDSDENPFDIKVIGRGLNIVK